MISGIVLARNEEANIVACLESLRPHVQEILLIDMESIDRTVELALPYISKVLHHPLVANFDAARNIAIPEAKFDWLWFVDADERVPPETGNLVNLVVRDQGHEFTALTIPFKTYFCGKWIEHCGWWPGYTMPRVLKRGHFRFSEKLHGGVQTGGPEMRISPDPRLAIDHYSYLSVEHYIQKVNRYTSTEAQQMARDGQCWDWRAAVRHMTNDLWMYYEANEGWRDGAHGWILSWLSGQYRWLSHAKLMDLARGQTTSQSQMADGDCPRSLDEVLAVIEDEMSLLRSRRPQLPLGLVWRSPLWDTSGYADDGRTQVKSMAGGDRTFSVAEICWSDVRSVLPPNDAAVINALSRTRRPPFSATITSCIPTLVEPDPAASLNILRTVFETDRIPSNWLPQIAKFDEVWVLSHHNAESFRRSGVPPERLRVTPACIDTDFFRPEGSGLNLPSELKERFVFLSVGDWQLRKGWDVLLRAYARTFSPHEQIGLLLKITRAHGHPMGLVLQQVDQALAQVGWSLSRRPDIVLWPELLSVGDMPALYRSVDAFVLASRGEGWGRPYMEAMACGLPVIGTVATANAEFMNSENSFVISSQLVDIPEEAASEIPVYRGHRWHEPSEDELALALRRVVSDQTQREQIAAQGLADVREKFNLQRGRETIERALAAAEERHFGIHHRLGRSEEARRSGHSVPDAEPVRVEWEGEFFAGHSFSNINEKLALELVKDDRLHLALRRVQYNPAYDADHVQAVALRRLMQREFVDGPQITVRHSYPPNWQPPETGLWVHIQPWEFGHLPVEWLPSLRDKVDEIWAPSHYVRKVYERSGVPAEKIQVIPWGVDPDVFHLQATALLLSTPKSFKFLFVGGTIYRKGFDLLLRAYLEEFRRVDDVCLVIKDMGTGTFYRYGNYREQVLAAQRDPSLPAMVYLDQRFTEGQLASLYTACHCLVAPYRGEGFGLPILEAMACGLPPIIPQGGAADDFTDSDTAYLLPNREISDTHPMPLCGPAMALSITIEDLRSAMRRVFEHREEGAERGRLAGTRVRSQFTWSSTAKRMGDRLRHLATRHRTRSPKIAQNSPKPPNEVLTAEPTPVTLCLATRNDEASLAECLSRMQPFVAEVIVCDCGSSDRSVAIAREYGALVIEHGDPVDDQPLLHQCANHASSPWLLWLSPRDRVAEEDAQQIYPLLQSAERDWVELTLPAPRSKLHADDGHPGKELRFWRKEAAAARALAQ